MKKIIKFLLLNSFRVCMLPLAITYCLLALPFELLLIVIYNTCQWLNDEEDRITMLQFTPGVFCFFMLAPEKAEYYFYRDL